MDATDFEHTWSLSVKEFKASTSYVQGVTEKQKKVTSNGTHRKR